MLLSNEECQEIYQKTKDKRCWLEMMASNDGRINLVNEDGILTSWWNAEFDEEEQAQAARLCAILNREYNYSQYKG